MAKRADIHTFILQNRAMFTPNSAFSTDAITSQFGLTIPTPSKDPVTNYRSCADYQCRKATLQMQFNNVLNEYGLYLKQVSHTNYVVLGLAEAQDEVAIHTNRARRVASVGVALHAGIKRHKSRI